MTIYNQTCEILGRTNDGDDLSPNDLYLIQTIVNGFNVTESDEIAFQKLHSDVTSGAYRKPWAWGVKNITQDHNGYVYWKGHQVEHYSFKTYSGAREAALYLAWVCEIRVKAGYKPGFSLPGDGLEDSIKHAISISRPCPKSFTERLPALLPGQVADTVHYYDKEPENVIETMCTFKVAYDWLDSEYERQWRVYWNDTQTLDIYTVIDSFFREGEFTPTYTQLADRIWDIMIKYAQNRSIEEPNQIFGLIVDSETPCIAFVNGEQVALDYK